MAFDPERLIQVLHAHGVRYVLIGGLAGRLWGSPTITNDVDICYARDRSNLESLAAAIRELSAKLRGVREDVPFLLDARTLEAGDHFTFTTDAGNLDCLATSSGSSGYESLVRTAVVMEIAGIEVKIAAIEDLLAMKRAAGHPKDLVEVEILSAVREERGSE